MEDIATPHETETSEAESKESESDESEARSNIDVITPRTSFCGTTYTGYTYRATDNFNASCSQITQMTNNAPAQKGQKPAMQKSEMIFGLDKDELLTIECNKLKKTDKEINKLENDLQVLREDEDDLEAEYAMMENEFI